jgi:hypothetical protein
VAFWWDTPYRLTAIAALALLFATGAAACAVGVARALRTAPPALDATLRSLAADLGADMTAAADILENRRQVLLATVALQRFALQGDVGSLRASLRPPEWTRPVAIAAAGHLGARWLAPPVAPLGGALGALAPALLDRWRREF